MLFFEAKLSTRYQTLKSITATCHKLPFLTAKLATIMSFSKRFSTRLLFTQHDATNHLKIIDIKHSVMFISTLFEYQPGLLVISNKQHSQQNRFCSLSIH